jgi:hypothetical protein
MSDLATEIRMLREEQRQTAERIERIEAKLTEQPTPGRRKRRGAGPHQKYDWDGFHIGLLKFANKAPDGITTRTQLARLADQWMAQNWPPDEQPSPSWLAEKLQRIGDELNLPAD